MAEVITDVPGCRSRISKEGSSWSTTRGYPMQPCRVCSHLEASQQLCHERTELLPISTFPELQLTYCSLHGRRIHSDMVFRNGITYHLIIQALYLEAFNDTFRICPPLQCWCWPQHKGRPARRANFVILDMRPSSQETLGDNRLWVNCLLEEVSLLMAIRCKTCLQNKKGCKLRHCVCVVGGVTHWAVLWWSGYDGLCWGKTDWLITSLHP